MQIDEHFRFGRYEGLTIREVYQGSEYADKELIKAYVVHKIEFPNVQDTIFEEMTYEVGDTLLRVKCGLFGDDSLNEDLTGVIQDLFRDTTTWTDDQVGNISIDNLNTKTAKQTDSIPKVGGGHPEYIDWCIRTVDGFYIDPDSIVELQSLTVFRLVGVKVNRKIEDIYEYGPKIKHDEFAFGQYTLRKNQEKYKDRVYSSRSDYRDSDCWDDNDEEGYCSACQQTPCMCSDTDPG